MGFEANLLGATMTDETTLPTAPERRSITPAPEDFCHQASARTLLWPLLWLGLALGLWAAVQALGWVLFAHE